MDIEPITFEEWIYGDLTNDELCALLIVEPTDQELDEIGNDAGDD